MRLAYVFLAATVACTVKSEKPSDTLSLTDTLAETTHIDSVSQTTVTPAPAQSRQTPTTQAPPSSTAPTNLTPDMTVTEYGIGPIRAGMTVAEVAKTMGGGFAAPKGGTEGCSYAVLTKAPKGLAVMLQDGRVARVEVRSGTIKTAAGARIGDSEERVKSLYPDVATTPHKYVAGGHYLTVTPSDPDYRIVFETDGKKVTGFRSGRVPEVNLVEGCG
jgi:uncharacterized protein YwbE